MNVRRWLTYALTLVLALSVSGVALAADSGPRRDFTEAPESYSQTEYVTVMLSDPPAALYTEGIEDLKRTKPERGEKLDPADPAVQAYVDYLAGTHQDFRDWLASKAPKAEIVREYSLVVNGFGVKLNGTRADVLTDGPGVRTVTFSTLHQPTMNVSVELIGASALWPDAGGRENAGAGVTVGVIDTGIDDTHRFFTACKDDDGDGDGVADIPHKVYFSGEGLQDPDRTLFFDHGTHVSGTVAGCVIELTEGPVADIISGVAPAAALADYNVFPGYGAGFVAFGGSAFSHDIIAALEDTVKDQVDVVNMSLGGGVEGPHDILAEAVDATVEAGLVVAVAAGNSGPGDATIQSPGSAPNALTAGASTNSHVIAVPVEVEGNTFVGAAGDFDPYADNPAEDEPLSDWNAATSDDDPLACDDADDPSAVEGTVTLISRGECTFTTKVRNAEEAGAIGVVVYNNVPGPPVSMAHDGTDPFPTIPAVMVSLSAGEEILTFLPTTTTIIGPPTELDAEPDILAGFSSRGPTPFTYLIKPDVTAPGVNVYSSVFDDDFASFQGTSMASPHLAGAAAVLIQLHPDWSQFDVKSAIVSSAERVVTATDLSGPAGVLGRGNGRVNVDLAHDVTATFDPVSVSYGLWEGNKPVEADVTVTVFDAVGDGASCSFEVTGDPYVSPASGEVDVPAGGSAELTLSIDAGRSDTTSSGDYGGDVVFNCDGVQHLMPWWVRIDREGKP